MPPFRPPESFPAIVGRKQMAAILGIRSNPNNAERLPDLPLPLHKRYGDDVIGVDQTPLWFRDEIEEYATCRRIDREIQTTT